ncbi:nucleotidyltransferase domain-containing protein [Hymenobacter weizhouensis]|uniref:nucleotidyltransferase domain-containing protein n=1 Tax=Hymenobacter sp. YIM 151500-1 TaxID=2987689 RepID=UPI002227A3A0|nr:nucleotidyltransferase domain-containing protein [Hymenobacter sp. YIM 151500-1]UYZ62592.1 nucleotidyltransferase domain-containing protein [Hymenobacter sp. YIM 151500-1]
MITEEQIQSIVRRIVEGYQPDRIILFGSYAYGTPTEDSDLDLLVIKAGIGESRMERGVAVRRLLRATDMPPMDILVRTPEEVAEAAEVRFTIEAQALKSGRMLYAAA